MAEISANERLPEVYFDHIKQKQKNDKELESIRNSLINDQPIHTRNLNDEKEEIELRHGMVMTNVKGKYVAIIPYKDRDEFVTQTHLDTITGHLQENSILHRIENFAFAKKARDEKLGMKGPLRTQARNKKKEDWDKEKKKELLGIIMKVLDEELQLKSKEKEKDEKPEKDAKETKKEGIRKEGKRRN